MNYLEKEGGGKVIGGLARLASKPFIGAEKSNALRERIINGISNSINQPIESALRRSGIHEAISRVYQHGMYPIPHTPKLVHPIIKDPAERLAYGRQRADSIVKIISENPEIIATLPIPAPGMTTGYLAGKGLLAKALEGGKPPVKLACLIESFSSEIEKIAQVMPYQQQTQWTCSAACLKAVLDHYDYSISEEEAVEAIGTIPNKGAECNQIAEAARKFGFMSFEYSFDSLEQAKILLDMDIPIICDIQSFNNPGKGHYVVMTDIENDTVRLMDSNTPTNQRIISIEEMDQRWWDRAMKPPHELMNKWGIVIIPE